MHVLPQSSLVFPFILLDPLLSFNHFVKTIAVLILFLFVFFIISFILISFIIILTVFFLALCVIYIVVSCIALLTFLLPLANELLLVLGLVIAGV